MIDLKATVKRQLGNSELKCAPVGLGCMSFSGAYGSADDEETIDFVRYAIETGTDFLDSSDMYGWGHNESVLGRALSDGYRDKVVLATKFGQTQLEGGGMGVDGRPEYVIEACEKSLRRLGVSEIDLYFQHRVDRNVPIEDTVGAMAKLVEQGKVRAIGICEAKPATIRRAHHTYPLAAVQSEFSLMYREEAEQIYETTAELGISFVAYSPLGRGMLTDQYLTIDAVDEEDPHHKHPRFSGSNFNVNRELAGRIARYADSKGCTPAQLALAWLIGRGEDIIVIPGTKRPERFNENIAALGLELTSKEIDEISALVPLGAALGHSCDTLAPHWCPL